MSDLISRTAAIDAVKKSMYENPHENEIHREMHDHEHRHFLTILMGLPSAQSERDIPIRPIETADRTWGISSRQAVCPKCGCYLGHVAFLGDYKGKRITYCETCGQAIDWEGWDDE